MATSEPCTMREAAVRAARRGMLGEPHIAPLAAYVAALRRASDDEYPDFDPADGGGFRGHDTYPRL